MQPKEGYEMSNSEKVDEAKKRKDAGNDLSSKPSEGPSLPLHSVLLQHFYP